MLTLLKDNEVYLNETSSFSMDHKYSINKERLRHFIQKQDAEFIIEKDNELFYREHDIIEIFVEMLRKKIEIEDHKKHYDSDIDYSLFMKDKSNRIRFILSTYPILRFTLEECLEIAYIILMPEIDIKNQNLGKDIKMPFNCKWKLKDLVPNIDKDFSSFEDE